MDVTSGNLSHSYGKWTIEIGDLPVQIVIFNSYVSLPEGSEFLTMNSLPILEVDGPILMGNSGPSPFLLVFFS